jgi:hypothetical protein
MDFHASPCRNFSHLFSSGQRKGVARYTTGRTVKGYDVVLLSFKAYIFSRRGILRFPAAEIGVGVVLHGPSYSSNRIGRVCNIPGELGRYSTRQTGYQGIVPLYKTPHVYLHFFIAPGSDRGFGFMGIPVDYDHIPKRLFNISRGKPPRVHLNCQML